jgi:hypothetical protein
MNVCINRTGPQRLNTASNMATGSGPRHRRTGRSIRLHALPCEISNRNTITSGQYKQREGFQSQQSTESQEQCIKTLLTKTHKHVTKSQRRPGKEFAKTETK